MNQIDEIFEKFKKHNPKPKIELFYTTNFNCLVAIILSAQSTDKGVNKVTQKLFLKIKEAKDILKLGLEKLTNEIKTIGLYKTKAKNVMKMSEIVLNEYNEQVPSNLNDLIKLPGVGRKTANVFLNTIHKEKCIPVDTHVFRVSHRLNLSSGKTPDKVEKELEKILPDKYKLNAANWLVLHGRYICKAKKPLCNSCFLNSMCPYFKSLQILAV